MPGRAGPAPDPDLRHRARRPAARLRAGRARPDRRGGPRLTLEKGHSAADWSTRPLPEPWLRYAALDVELLVELRDVARGRARGAGQARVGGAGVRRDRRRAPGAPARGAVAAHVRPAPPCASAASSRWSRALWEARDDLARPARHRARARAARRGDRQPRRWRCPRPRPSCSLSPCFNGRRCAGRWRPGSRPWTPPCTLPEDDLPDLKARYDGPPPARSWPERDPEAAARLAAGRAAVAAIATEHNLPTENLLAPDSSAGSPGRRPTTSPNRWSPTYCAVWVPGSGRCSSPRRRWPRRWSRRRKSTRSSPHLPPSPTIWLGKPYLPRSEGPFACSPTTSSACAKASRRRWSSASWSPTWSRPATGVGCGSCGSVSRWRWWSASPSVPC